MTIPFTLHAHVNCDVGVIQGKFILTPCPITYAEEQLLHFFGQLLGIAIRADVPLPLDLLGSFWKGLVGEALDPETDFQEADLLTYNYIKKFESVRDIKDSLSPSKTLYVQLAVFQQTKKTLYFLND